MNARQFFDAVVEMRQLQRQYAKSGKEADRKLAKAAEVVVDLVIRNVISRLNGK